MDCERALARLCFANTDRVCSYFPILKEHSLAAPTPFQIAIPDAEIDDLKRRLRATRFPNSEPVDDWSQGIPLAYV